MREISQQGIEQLKKFEGEKLVVYNDGYGFLTVGCGHLVKPIDGLKLGNKISQEQSTAFFQRDLESYVKIVNDFVKVPLQQNQFDMLVSLAFNIGIGNFKSSSLLKVLNQGNYVLAGKKFSNWIYSAGKKSKGLVSRRAKEQDIFLHGYK